MPTARSSANGAPAAPPRPAPEPVRHEIARTRLLTRLGALDATDRLVLVSASCGYGKTTLLAQWARHIDAPVAWATARRDEQGPGALLHDLAVALGPLSGAAPGASLPAVRAALTAAGRPIVLVLDDADALAAPEALGAVAGLIAELPPGSRVAVGCRSDPDLPLGRRLVEGGLVRIGPDDLAFDDAEAAALMAASGVEVAPAALAGLRERVEGWPAGLRLAAVRMAAAADPSAAAASFAGDDRLVARYLRETALARLSDEHRSLLVRTSVLDRLDARACDAVAGTAGSGRALWEMERGGVPLVALDDRDAAYRPRRYLRDMLRAELGSREPELVPVLHRRASACREAAGTCGQAVRHALAAGDVDRAAALTWRSVPGHLTRGRAATLRAMLAGFDIDRVAGSAPLSLAAGWCSVEGEGDLVAHHLALAERAGPVGADEATERAVAAGIMALRALLARDGLGQMGRDAAEGFRIAPDAGPWRAYCRFVEGAACHLAGDVDRARELLEDGIERAGRIAPSVHALCLSQLALLLLDHDEPVRALMLARRARAVVEEWALGGYASAASSRAVCALALAGSGHEDEAREALGQARRTLSQTGDASAWLAVQTRVVVARAGLATGDDAAAHDALRETERFLGSLGDTPSLRDEVERLRRRVRPVPEGDAACLSSITTAETRVLRLLPTHHSFREIGDLLFLSRFTVKSHAHALYRKLGVSSRSEAVERARQLRILEAPPA